MACMQVYMYNVSVRLSIIVLSNVYILQCALPGCSRIHIVCYHYDSLLLLSSSESMKSFPARSTGVGHSRIAEFGTYDDCINLMPSQSAWLKT